MIPDVTLITECFSEVRRTSAGAPESQRYERYYENVSALLTQLLRHPVGDLLPLLRACDESAKTFIRGISMGSAIYAVRSSDRKWLRLGVQGLYVEDILNGEDAEGTIVKLTLLANSAAKLNLHLIEVCWELKQEIPEFIETVLQIPPKTLKSINYVEGKDPSGQFTYTLTM